MSTRSGQQRIQAVPSEPRPPTPVALMAIAPMVGDWDDDDELVDFQDGDQDDTVTVAPGALQGAEGTQERSGMTGKESESVVTPRPDGAPPADLTVMIRVSGNGAVVTNKGGTEEQAGLVAYAHRLVDLVGDLLGLERFLAAECIFKPSAAGGAGASPQRCLMFTESNGDAVLLRPRTNADLQALRDSLGL